MKKIYPINPILWNIWKKNKFASHISHLTPEQRQKFVLELIQALENNKYNQFWQKNKLIISNLPFYKMRTLVKEKKKMKELAILAIKVQQKLKENNLAFFLLSSDLEDKCTKIGLQDINIINTTTNTIVETIAEYTPLGSNINTITKKIKKIVSTINTENNNTLYIIVEDENIINNIIKNTTKLNIKNLKIQYLTKKKLQLLLSQISNDLTVLNHLTDIFFNGSLNQKTSQSFIQLLKNNPQLKNENIIKNLENTHNLEYRNAWFRYRYNPGLEWLTKLAFKNKKNTTTHSSSTTTTTTTSSGDNDSSSSE